MESNPGGPPPLQFDTVVPQVTPGKLAMTAGVTCAMCQRAIATEYFDVNGQSVCASCRTQLAQMAETPRSWGVFAKAGLFGLVAAIAGAILYYAVIAITNFEIGIVAIAIGYMVGWTIRKGTAGRGGRRFQVLAVVLTYWAVGLAYTPLTFQQIAEEDKKEQAAATTTEPAAPAATQPSETEDANATKVSIPLALGILFGLSLALPVLAVVTSLPSGLISGAIIAFGMQQAWRMTGVPPLQISGPFQIAGAPPAV
jgi:F0F1-type ATP synthase assembly protein I